MVANVVGSGRVPVPFVAAFNDFSAARSQCDFPVFAHFRWFPLNPESTVRFSYWCDGPLPGFHLLPWKIPFLAGAKFPLLYFTFSFLVLFPFIFLFFFSLRLWPSRFVVASSFSVLAALGGSTWNCQLLGSRRVALATHPPASGVSSPVLVAVVVVPAYKYIHPNTHKHTDINISVEIVGLSLCLVLITWKWNLIFNTLPTIWFSTSIPSGSCIGTIPLRWWGNLWAVLLAAWVFH